MLVLKKGGGESDCTIIFFFQYSIQSSVRVNCNFIVYVTIYNIVFEFLTEVIILHYNAMRVSCIDCIRLQEVKL